MLDFMSQWLKEEADFRFRMSFLGLKLPLLGILRDILGNTIPYNLNFASENGDLRPKNIYFWNISP